MPFPEEQRVLVRNALKAIANSELFRSSVRQRRFLDYVVDETLNGRGARLSGYAVGLEVFDRPADFDPTTDAIVRVEAGRLRSKLVEYYSRVGASDPVEIILPRGRYAPEFRFRGEAVSQRRATSAIEHGTSIAVLPLENLNGGPEQDYFCDGLADDLITALLQVSGLTVLSRYATFRFKGQLGEPQTIASSLGVDYLLLGSVRYERERIRVSLQLIDGPSARTMWSQRYDETLENVFDAQDHVVSAVVTFLKDALTPGEHTRLAQRGTRNLAAFEAFMKGAYEASRPDMSAAWIDRCTGHFLKAYESDPAFGEPLARISRLEVARLGNGLGDPAAILARCQHYAEEAVRVSPNSALCSIALAWAHVHHRRYDEALELTAKAVALEPGSAEISVIAGLVLAQSGRLTDGLAYLERGLHAEKLVTPIYAWAAGMVYFATGDYDRGREALVDLLQKAPVLVAANVVLAADYVMLGDEAKAIAQIEFVYSHAPAMPSASSQWSGMSNWRDPEVQQRIIAAITKAYLLAGITPPE